MPDDVRGMGSGTAPAPDARRREAGARAARPSASATGARRAALEALGEVLAGRGKLQEVLSQRVAFHHLSERDPALARTLAAGCIRRLRTLDTVLEAFCRPASEERDIQQPVRHILRLGLYQLLFCGGIPARAAVNESVELARQTGYGRATGFVNAVLRAIERDFRIVEGAEVDRKCAVLIGTDRWAVFGKELFPDPQRSPVAYLSRQLSYPEWLVRRWVARYGVEKTWGLCLAGNEEAPVFLRPHPPNADAARLVEILAQEGIEASLSTSGRTVRLPAGVNTASLKVLRQGCCLVQDDSAAAVVPFLAPARGSRVLDLCAAPGGKACQLAEGVGEEGAVIAVDNDARRLRRVFENIERLGLANVAVVEADGRSLPDLGGPFDYALVDAPCSNTAVLRRRLEARWRVTEAGLAELSRLQYELARSAAAALKPGGKMVYSTCTMEPEENQNVLTALVAAGLNMAMEEERQFYPSLGGGDGVYMARLARQTSGGGVKKTRDE